MSGLFGKYVKKVGRVIGLVPPSPEPTSQQTMQFTSPALDDQARAQGRWNPRASPVLRQRERAVPPAHLPVARNSQSVFIYPSPVAVARARSPPRAVVRRRSAAAAPRVQSRWIAAGSGGCVYRPRMTCDQSTPEGIGAEVVVVEAERVGRMPFVSKMCTLDACEKEFHEGGDLEFIDVNQQFHIKPQAICKPSQESIDDYNMDIDIIDNRPRKNKCKPVEDRQAITTAKILLSPDGGASLHMYKNVTATAPPAEFMKRISTTIIGFVNLFNGLALMNENGFYHNDIKPANIVIGTDINNPVFKFIDFGLSFRMPGDALPRDWNGRNLIRMLNMYDYKYIYWPIDSNILLPSQQTQDGQTLQFNPADIQQYVTNWVTSGGCTDIIEYFLLNGAANTIGYGTNRDDLIQGLTANLRQMYDLKNTDDPRYSYNNILRKIDIYGLAISFIESIKRLFKEGGVLEDRVFQFIVQSRVLYVDPSMRPLARDFAPLYAAFVRDLIRDRLITDQ